MKFVVKVQLQFHVLFEKYAHIRIIFEAGTRQFIETGYFSKEKSTICVLYMIGHVCPVQIGHVCLMSAPSISAKFLEFNSSDKQGF